MSVIHVNKLKRDYGDGKGVFDLSFSIEKGESFGFLGPNGAGKTTTIRHLMGFLKPEAGSCSMNGLDCWKDCAVIQEKVGYVPGEISFFDDMNGADYLRFIEHYRKIRTKSRKDELLAYYVGCFFSSIAFIFLLHNSH